MNCTFFGYRNAPYSIRKKLKKAIESLADEGCENFFVGNFAISKRNEWMIKNSDVAVVYLLDTATNTAKWIERARKKGLEIINLAKDS